ncbi:MAG TPA: YHS domain-containing (seleno)protein [Holophagaceae bacterium]|nr:YHS domain-containing (seleno)protein [Holophagaceae bacterium]
MRTLLLTSLLALSLGASAQAQTPAVKAPTATTLNLLGPGVGVEGFDPVSYWPEGGSKPVQGTIKLTYMHEGVAYRFANEQNLATFKSNPNHFLPQYGGYCAWALGAINQRVDVNPNHYVIRDGKLYLFFSDANVVTRDLWKKDAAALVEKADAAYAQLLAK